jgi:hypothetical protein
MEQNLGSPQGFIFLKENPKKLKKKPARLGKHCFRGLSNFDRF